MDSTHQILSIDIDNIAVVSTFYVHARNFKKPKNSYFGYVHARYFEKARQNYGQQKECSKKNSVKIFSS